MKKLYVFLVFFAVIQQALAGSGKIEGKIFDEKGETLIGATVMLEGTTWAGKSDMDGKFTLRNVEDGKYTLVVSYISYDKKNIAGLQVKNGQCEFLNIAMQKSDKGLKDVVIKSQVKKESINALMLQQKNLATISDGISGELMKKTPDRNTGDVLKRISGVSIAENKFAVIRGLADRYNMAMLNGNILPSSEADRKAFSFDIIPTNLLDNIVIIKAATPDRPGEFAGGIIEMTTRDIPSANFLQVQIGSGMNTISTFKAYSDSRNSKTDWLGYDKSMRIIPSSFPTKETFNLPSAQFSLNDRIEASKQFDNTWGVTQKNHMSPFRNAQLSAGYVKNFNTKTSLGVLGSVSYSRNLRTYTVRRNEVNGSTRAYDFNDTIHRDNVLIGSMLNIGLKINANHRITFKNSFSINSDDQTVRRSGDFIDNEYFVKGTALWFSNNQLLSNQLSSEHILTKRKIKVQLGLGRHQITRSIPDLRRSYYTMNYDTQDSTYIANISTFPNTFFMGRFFAKTVESIYSGNVDIKVPYTFMNKNQSVKIGAFVQQKHRDYNARVLAYVRAKSAGFQTSLLTLPEQQLFDPSNISSTGLVLSDATQPMDQYTASSNLNAAYIMNDNLIAEKFRFVYGVRIERFQQQLTTGNLVPGDLTVKKQNTDFLPSLNFTYLLNKNTNIRVCASKTLSRPEFRELSPASFYDYNLSATFRGNPDLKQTTIRNFDLRYEYYMNKGEMISASAFYKRFSNAIETAVPFGFATTQKVFSYTNAPDANSYGLELEFRKSLGGLSGNERSILNQFTVFGNMAYIRSTVHVQTSAVGGETQTYTRPMQGQSPYIINGGISYEYPKAGLSATMVYNRIGERIFSIGNGEIPELYEAPRNILDLSISKKFYKKLEAKLTISDMISNPVIYYYNIDKKYQMVKGQNAFNRSDDFTVIRMRQGTNIGFSLSYLFGK